MRDERGFTLVELLIVIAIIGIIAGIAVLQLRTRPQAAKEAVLKENLYAMRDVIDQYFSDKGKYPESLDTLVDDGYMRRIPVDPITNSAESWQTVQAEATEDDPLLVDDDARVRAGRPNPLLHVREPVGERADGHVSMCDVPGQPVRNVRPFVRQPVGAPVLLAGDVVVHAVEPHRVEPPRGSRAEVSLVVVAVDDHRPLAVELARRALVELFERDADRADDVFLLEFLRRQHFDQVRVLVGDQAADLVSVNRPRRHQSFDARLRRIHSHDLLRRPGRRVDVPLRPATTAGMPTD